MLLTALVYSTLSLLEPSTSRQDRVAVLPQEALATISGLVLDGDGKPLDHVYVVSYPVLRGTFAHAQTDETGRFTLSVAKDGLYMVVLETEELDLDEKADSPAMIQPGQGEVKLVLRRPNRMTFTVVDQATGAPIERYGLGIANKPNLGVHGGIDQEDIPLRAYARGESVAHADPARHVVRVQSPGYASVESEITPEGDTGTRQTLRLKKGSSLFGRVATEGRPVSHASVAVVRGPVGTVYSGTDRYEADSWFLMDYRKDLGDYVGRPRLVESAADGSFRFDDLSTGTYDLLVESPRLGPALLKKIRVDVGEGRDVGVLTLGAPATIRGRVVAGPEVSPVGMQYSLDGYDRQEIANADGTFTIEGLGAGLHQLTLLRNASLSREDAREMRLRPGKLRRSSSTSRAPLPALSKCTSCVLASRRKSIGSGLSSRSRCECPGWNPGKRRTSIIFSERMTSGGSRVRCPGDTKSTSRPTARTAYGSDDRPWKRCHQVDGVTSRSLSTRDL